MVSTDAHTGVSNKLNYCKGNYSDINDRLQLIEWDCVFKDKSLEQRWASICNHIRTLTEHHVPLMSESRRHKNKGISKETINQIKLRNAGWRDYRRQPSEDKLRRYKDKRNRTNAMVRADKDRQMSRTLQSFKGKPKKFYAHMRRLQTVKD